MFFTRAAQLQVLNDFVLNELKTPITKFVAQQRGKRMPQAQSYQVVKFTAKSPYLFIYHNSQRLPITVNVHVND